MEKIIDYCVLCQENSRSLKNEVVFLMKKGWQPIGGASMCLGGSEDGNNGLSQAMVKYEPK